MLIELCILQACEDGYYGKECNSTCGHCFYQNDCFHENGTCLNGCKLGYSGELCQKGEKINEKKTVLFSSSNNQDTFYIEISHMKTISFSTNKINLNISFLAFYL